MTLIHKPWVAGCPPRLWQLDLRAPPQRPGWWTGKARKAPEPVEVGGRSSGGPAPGWTQVRSLQRYHSSIFGQGPGLDGWPPEDGQQVRTAKQEGEQTGSVTGEALLTRSPQLPDIQAAPSYKIPKSFTYQSPLRLPLNILEEPPLQPRELKKDKSSLPPIAGY